MTQSAGDGSLVAAGRWTSYHLRVAIVVIGLAAVALRLGLGLGHDELPAIGDGTHYDRIARSLLAGTGFGEAPGFATAHRAPLHPGLLAILYALLGAGWRSGVVGGAVVGGVTTVACGLLAAQLAPVGRGASAGLTAAVIAALYPRLIDYSVRRWSLSEGLLVALLMVGLVTWSCSELAHGRERLAWAGLTGVALGLAALTRPVFLAFPGLLLVRGRRGRLAPPVVALALCALTIAPWAGRNQRLFKRFVPVSTMAGIVFYQGFHPPAAGWGATPWAEIQALTRDCTNEAAVSAKLVRITLGDIAAAPGAALRLLPLKAIRLISPFSEGDGGFDGAFVGLAVAGLLGVIALRKSRGVWFPAAVLVYVPVLAMVFYGSPRFRLPMEPVLIVFAAIWIDQFRRTPGGRWLLAAAGLGLLLLTASGIDAARLRSLVD